MSKFSESDVKHSKSEKMFYIDLQSGAKAFLQYETNGASEASEVDLWHTEVPSECRGQGIAGILAEVAVKSLAKENSKVLLTCTYLQHFYKKNSDKFAEFSNIHS